MSVDRKVSSGGSHIPGIVLMVLGPETDQNSYLIISSLCKYLENVLKYI